MTVDMEKAIKWMYDTKATGATYSMQKRDGKASYDCSSAVYYALRAGGATSAGWAVNTEYMHDWLIKNGFELVSENKYWDSKRGDIFIWGKKGASSGAGGHTGIFVDKDNIIHMNYPNNGITIDNHDKVWALSGKMYFYAYRLKTQPSKPKKLGWIKDNKGWKYFKADGFPMQGEWVEHKDKWYYLKEDGYMASSEWIKSKHGDWYYLKEDGSMAVNEVLKLDKLYLFDREGRLDTEMKKY